VSIASKPYYWLVCDDCGQSADYGDFSAMAEPGEAVDSAINSGWTTDGEKHHCPSCPSLSQCHECGKPAGEKAAGDRDDHCLDCWDKAGATERMDVP
jgi:hypothetical protein